MGDWEKERDLRRVKNQLDTVLKGNKDPSKWDSSQYSKVYEHLQDALNLGLDDPKDPFHLGALSLIRQAERCCETYEAEEARRRVIEKRAKDNESTTRAVNSQKLISSECSKIFSHLEQLKAQRWDGANILTELNGPILETKALGDLAAQLRSLASKVKRESMDTESVERLDLLYKEIQDIFSSVETLEHKMQGERRRRQALEDDARAQLDQQKQEEAAKYEAQRLEHQEQEAHKAAKEEAQRRAHFVYAAEKRLNQIDGDMKQILASQHNASKSDMYEEVNQLREIEKRQQEQEFDNFEKSLFGDLQSVKIDETPSELPRSDVAVKGISKLKAKRQKRLKEKQNEEKRRRNYEEAEKVKRHAQKIQNEQRLRMMEEQEKERKRIADEARAEMDEGDDDTEEEKRARAEARKVLMKYTGDVWSAAKEGDLEMVKRFFLVEGSQYLLALRNLEDEAEGGRTLLHTACWYGHEALVSFLLKLGAEVNAFDTALSRTTPLIEAARAGRRQICKHLISHGANIKIQDSHGDTALHWASRRGWGSVLVTIVKQAEDTLPGSTRGVFDIENYKRDLCLSIAKNAHVREISRRDLGVTIISTADEDRIRGGRKGNKVLPRKRNQALPIKKTSLLKKGGSVYLDESLLHEDPEIGANEEFQELQNNTSTEKVQGLDELGLDLGDFSYSRR